MITNILFFTITILAFGVIFWQIRHQEKQVQAVLAAKLSEDVHDFRNATQTEKKTKQEPRIGENEMAMEDVDPEDLLNAVNVGTEE